MVLRAWKEGNFFIFLKFLLSSNVVLCICRAAAWFILCRAQGIPHFTLLCCLACITPLITIKGERDRDLAAWETTKTYYANDSTITSWLHVLVFLFLIKSNGCKLLPSYIRELITKPFKPPIYVCHAFQINCFRICGCKQQIWGTLLF